MKITLIICSTVVILFFSYFYINKYEYRTVSYVNYDAKVKVNILTKEECTIPEGNALIKGLQKYFPKLCED